MARFNLIEEPWIRVLSAENGEQKEVSMRELFRNAGNYKALAGEMETQNFAVLRFLLAVLQTVFSRFDFEGNVLPGIELNEMWIQTEPVDEDDLEEFIDASDECWEKLYKAGRFPDIVTDYLEKWKDHFNLFDEEYPFLQVNKREMDEIIEDVKEIEAFKAAQESKEIDLDKIHPTDIFGRTMNRTISESGNKVALFSPVFDWKEQKTKDIMTEAEFVRWLITFQGYTGVSDKTSLVDSKRKNQNPSAGWLFDIGGILLKGDTVFETLIKNLMTGSALDMPEYSGRIQKPCWEMSGIEAVKRICAENTIDNLAELYTNRSRAVLIDTKANGTAPCLIKSVKLPAILHNNNFIEPMTLWEGGKNNDYNPKKHEAGQALWRSFGLITMRPSGNDGIRVHPPGIYNQYKRLVKVTGNRWSDIVGISMQKDRNATSQLPVNEIVDGLRINDLVITDDDPDGWLVRINDAVNTTKSIIDKDYKKYLRDICEVRNWDSKNMNVKGFISKGIEEMYAVIDPEFREWIYSIKPEDAKEDRIKEWYEALRELVLRQGEELFNNSSSRDLKGIETKSGIENIATKYWKFVRNINLKLNKGGRQ